MISSSLQAKIICIIAATAAVMGVVALSNTPTPITIAGAGEASEARMGNSFEDMSIGTLTAVSTKIVVEAVMPARAPAPKTLQPAATPRVSAAVQPTRAATPLALASQAVALKPTTAATAPLAQPITATADASASPQSSSRPKQRDPALAAKAAPPEPVKRAKPVQKKPAKQEPPRGNAARSANTGTASGTTASRATTQGSTKQQSRESGNAAALNYPGKVLRRISRVGKPRVNNRGTAVVAFSISGSGGLASLSIARSSGSPALDQAALRVIRKAAPFPAPPRGAQRSYSIKVKGR